MVATTGLGDMARFRVLATGYGISSFGSYLNMVALNLFVYQATGSALSTGLFMALRLASAFVAGLLGGTIAARFPRKPVMIACDLGQAAVLIAIVLAPQPLSLHLLPVVALCTGLLGTTSTVLLRSSVPELVGPERRQHANGLLVTGRAVAMALGFAAGGVLISWLGFEAAFLLDAATFAVSASILTCLALPFSTRAAASDGESYLTRQRLALVALSAAPTVLVIVLVRTIDTLGSASQNVGMPVYATLIQPGGPASFVGNFWGAWAVGLIVAHQLITRMRRDSAAASERRYNERAFVIGTIVMSAAFIGAFAGVPQPWVLLIAVVAGVADGFTEITYTTRIQAEPDPARGYFFGLTAMAESAGLGAGMVVAAGLLEVWSPFSVTAVMHGVVIALTLSCLAVIATRRRPAAADSVPVG